MEKTLNLDQLKIQTNDMLDVVGLGVTLQNKKILEDITFKVKKGTSLAIVGPNGGGKTTVFRALLNLVPYTGTVRWNDKIRMGYVPQSLVSTDLPISVEEFLRFKCKTDLEACIKSVGLEKSILSQKLGSLSGGELQRVLIAWAIVDNPNVLLGDEPTSGVDIGAEEPIYEMIDRLKKETGITILFYLPQHARCDALRRLCVGLKKKSIIFWQGKGPYSFTVVEHNIWRRGCI